MSGRTIAIGDIHGCATALEAVLKAIDPQPDDLIVTLGDYIDRGPDSRRVVEQLIELDRQCKLVPLVGNHEVMLLQALANDRAAMLWRECGGEETLASYGGELSDIPREHLKFFSRCRRFFETDSHFFVHANYDPALPLDQQTDELLLWTHICKRMPKPHASGKIAVVGHTPQGGRQVLETPHLVCLDTCCYGHGCLSAMELATRQLWQATPDGRLANPASR